MNFIDPSLQQPQRQRRPAPRFDMDLKALFSDDEHSNRHSASQRGTSQAGVSQSIKQEATNMFPNRSNMAPPLSHSLSLQQSQQTSPGAYGPSPPIDPSLQRTPPIPRQSPNQHQSNYMGNLPQPYGDSAARHMNNSGYGPGNFDSLDFLEGFNVGSNGVGGLQLAGGGDNNGGLTDLDLGFGVGGLAFDGGAGPSWEENGGFDLFDGFFFGGSASGGGNSGL